MVKYYRINTTYRLGAAAHGVGRRTYDVEVVTTRRTQHGEQEYYDTISVHKTFKGAQKALEKLQRQQEI